jgi:hypothetical protein
MNLNSEGNIIQQAYDKVQALEEIQKRKAVFSDDDVKENEGREDFQEDEEPTPTEQDEQIEEEE